MMMLPVLLGGGHLSMVVADPVPQLDVQPSCRAAAAGDIGIKQDLQSCLADERNARDQVPKECSQFTAADRKTCLELTTTGGNPTYTEYLTCLEMNRDARKLP